jgi:hypothetical protein
MIILTRIFGVELVLVSSRWRAQDRCGDAIKRRLGHPDRASPGLVELEDERDRLRRGREQAGRSAISLLPAAASRD